MHTCVISILLCIRGREDKIRQRKKKDLGGRIGVRYVLLGHRTSGLMSNSLSIIEEVHGGLGMIET